MCYSDTNLQGIINGQLYVGDVMNAMNVNIVINP